MSPERLHLLVRLVLKLATPPQTSKTDSKMIIRRSSYQPSSSITLDLVQTDDGKAIWILRNRD